MKHNHVIILILIAIVLGACSPSEGVIQTAIAETNSVSTAIQAEISTSTPSSTATPKSTNTPRPTSTQTPPHLFKGEPIDHVPDISELPSAFAIMEDDGTRWSDFEVEVHYRDAPNGITVVYALNLFSSADNATEYFDNLAWEFGHLEKYSPDRRWCMKPRQNRA